MDERFENARKQTIAEILATAQAGADGFKGQSKYFDALLPQLLEIARISAEAAFDRGYDFGYMNGVDDTKDID